MVNHTDAPLIRPPFPLLGIIMELCTSITLVTHPPSNPNIQSETPNLWRKMCENPQLFQKDFALVEDLDVEEVVDMRR